MAAADILDFIFV